MKKVYVGHRLGCKWGVSLQKKQKRGENEREIWPKKKGGHIAFNISLEKGGGEGNYRSGDGDPQ